MLISEGECIWAAGFFEGEGSVRINKPTKRNLANLLVDMVNVEFDLVDFFQQRWPGYFFNVKSDGNRNDFYRWRISSWKAAAFLKCVKPYIRGCRRERIELALEFQYQKSRSGTVSRTAEYHAAQWDYYERMKVLNKRGRVKEVTA